MFDPTRFAGRIRFQFLLSLASLIIYAAVPTAVALSLVFDAVSIYFFFTALATAALAARDISRQQALWQLCNPAQRQAWLEERSRQREITRQFTEIIAEGDTVLKTVKANEKIRVANQRKHRHYLRIVRFRQTVSEFYHWSIIFRIRIDPGKRLLSGKERLWVVTNLPPSYLHDM